MRTCCGVSLSIHICGDSAALTLRYAAMHCPALPLPSIPDKTPLAPPHTFPYPTPGYSNAPLPSFLSLMQSPIVYRSDGFHDLP